MQTQNRFWASPWDSCTKHFY